MNKRGLFRGMTAMLCILLAAAVSLTDSAFYYSGYVNSFLGLTGAAETSGEGSEIYASAYGERNAENAERLIADEKDHCIRAMEEGAVLLRNENGALPLSAAERSVTLFGNGVKDPVYRTNAGNAFFDAGAGGTLYEAFEGAGFRVNPVMRAAYDQSGVSRVSAAGRGTSSIGEVPLSFYTEELKASFAGDYNDAAIVMFTRYAGEGVDLDLSDAEGLPMLSLHPAERDLLQMIRDSGTFKKTIVLINSPFPMDVQWIEEEAYGVDACLVFGAAGNYGFIGVANILSGVSDVSGHLADTWAADSRSSAAMQNFGDYQFTDLNSMYMDRYLVYAEDIYVGYKYYETRYADEVRGLRNAASPKGAFVNSERWSYADEMAYPFGYGLSYARFTEKLDSVTWDRDAHTLTALVTVTNEGGYDGASKALVQLYARAPWAEGMAEKSAVQLIGFEKTRALKAGEQQTVTITLPDYYFASYDEGAVNGADPSLTGCYVLDAGDYGFGIGSSSHDALNNILAAEGVTGLFDEQGDPVAGDDSKAAVITLETADNTTWAKSPYTGEIVSNRLQDADLNYYKEGAVTYMTRADWETFPESVTGLEAGEQLAALMTGVAYEKSSDAPDTGDLPFGRDAGLMLSDMKDIPFDDDRWVTFIDQLTINQLSTICADNRGNVAIPEVGKPANASTNGPCGIQGSYGVGGRTCTLYVDEPTQAATFNLELARERGAFMAEDAAYTGVTMVFGPGANIHRTPYLGRCSEYFSEDGLLSFLMSRENAKPMTERGIITGFKHFCLNDQEVNRHGVATFATEQACREIYFKAFEGAMSDDNALGIMTSYNRIGMTASPAHEGAQIGILRKEWGFKGINITDSSKDAASYVLTAECITSGTDLFLSDTGRASSLNNLAVKNRDGTILQWMKTANKHFYYAHSRSILMNGLTEETVIEETVYWWQPALKAVCIGFGALTLLSLGVYAALSLPFGRRNKAATAGGPKKDEENGGVQ